MMTAQEIINQALLAGREQFRAALIRQAEEHDDAARRTSNVRARQGAEAQRNACLACYDDAAYYAVNDICADLGKCVIALNVACKMLGISPAQRTAAIVAWEQTQKERGEW